MILHIMVYDKFIPSFIQFINENFQKEEHIYIIIGYSKYYGVLEHFENIYFLNMPMNENDLLKILKLMKKSKKIFLHGLWIEQMHYLLLRYPKLFQKVYWMMWGGDFYFPEKQTQAKKEVIKNIQHFVTYIKGDYELVQKWYDAQGEFHKCFMYPSNLYKEYLVQSKKHQSINIQLGNSADPTNNHIEVLRSLEQYKSENINIFVPLSYGSQEYANEVIKIGKNIFDKKFISLREFMSFEKYFKFLSEIDIAIFAHNRQQAMGNIISLLGLGKKVYLRKDITPWKLFQEIGIEVFDIQNNFNLDFIDQNIQKNNREKIKEYFSKDNYLQQLQQLFRI